MPQSTLMFVIKDNDNANSDAKTPPCTHNNCPFLLPQISHISFNFDFLQCLPPAIVDVPLQFTANKALDTMAEPQVAQHGVIPLLVEVEQPSMTEAQIHLAVLVDVGCVAEGP